MIRDLVMGHIDGDIPIDFSQYTLSYTQNMYGGTIYTYYPKMFFSSDGNNLYMVNGSAGTAYLRKYKTSSPFVAGSFVSFVNMISISNTILGTAAGGGIKQMVDDLTFLAFDSTNKFFVKIVLTAESVLASDSPAVVDHTQVSPAIDIVPAGGVFFNNDGTEIYALNGSSIYSYTLSVAYDVTSLVNTVGNLIPETAFVVSWANYQQVQFHGDYSRFLLFKSGDLQSIVMPNKEIDDSCFLENDNGLTTFYGGWMSDDKSYFYTCNYSTSNYVIKKYTRNF